MKTMVMTTCGVLGSTVSYLFGSWTASMTTLCIFMALDFITGIVNAAVFKASPKSESGTLCSHAAFEGLIKKCMILVFVLVGARLDLIFGLKVIRDGVCSAFIVSELISLTENAGLMGLPLPDVVKRAIELLKDREDSK
jgi:toxin secretion/phage lysis holin